MKHCNFTCKIFITLEYKDSEWRRDTSKTLDKYIKSWIKSDARCKYGGPLEIKEVRLIKENVKSGKHDGYAKGNLYEVFGIVGYDIPMTKSNLKFRIFHHARVDYFCAWPVLYNSIKINTDSRVFKKVFSGKAISKSVVWTGNPSEFSYFIKLIYTINQYVDDLKQRNWEVACRCFVQADGTSFDRSKLRTLKKPQRSYKQLELAVDNLK